MPSAKGTGSARGRAPTPSPKAQKGASIQSGAADSRIIENASVKTKLGLQQKQFSEACYAFWLGGAYIKNAEPQGDHGFCQVTQCIPEVVEAMSASIKETGSLKLFNVNVVDDDPHEMIARGQYVMSQFCPLAQNCALLVNGYLAGGPAVTAARSNFPMQFLHYHGTGHGAVASPQTQRGSTAFVHIKLSRVMGANGIHAGTMGFSKMEGDASYKEIASKLQDDVADGPHYRQEWQAMKPHVRDCSGAATLAKDLAQSSFDASRSLDSLTLMLRRAIEEAHRARIPTA